MREKLKKNIKYVLSSTLIVFALSGCLKDDDETPIFTEKGDKFHLNMPTSAVVITRSDAIPPDSKINVDGFSYIFAFDYISGAQKSRLVLTSEHIDYKSGEEVTLLVPSAFENGDRIVFVFNAQLKAGEKLEDFIYSDIDAMFQMSGGESATIISKGFPMYGEIKFNSITTPKVTITRAVAKLEVIIPQGGLYVGSGTTKDFNVGTVTYNIYQNAVNGNITSIIDGINHIDENDNLTNDITLIGEINKPLTELNSNNDVPNRITYLYEYPYSTNIIGKIGPTPITISTSDPHRFAIILKQSVGGVNKFYRLDLCNQTGGNISYLDIKRNNYYKVNITKVNSIGYDTATQALNSPASNIEYEIIDDTGEEVISNGQYALSIGKQPLSGETRYHAELPDIATKQTDGSYELVLSDKVKYILPEHMTELPSGVTATIELISNVTGVSLKSTQLTDNVEDVTLIIPANVIIPASGLTARFRVKLGNITYLSSSVRLIHPNVKAPSANCIIVPPGTASVIVPINNINVFWGPGGEGTVSYKANPDNSSYDRDYMWKNLIDDGDYNVHVISNTVGSNPTVITKTADNFTINGLTNGEVNGSIIVGVYRTDDVDYKECLWSWHLWVTTARPLVVNRNWGSHGEYGCPYLHLEMLDRDLGDRTGDVSNWTSYNPNDFSFYQWGRKDPLLDGATMTSAKYFYESVYNPLTITFNDATKGHGGTVDAPSKWSRRWSLSDQLHNPCPAGWTIPPTSLINRTPYFDNWNSSATAPIRTHQGPVFDGRFGYTHKTENPANNEHLVFTANAFLNLSDGTVHPLGNLRGKPYHAIKTWSASNRTPYVWNVAPASFGTTGSVPHTPFGSHYKPVSVIRGYYFPMPYWLVCSAHHVGQTAFTDGRHGIPTWFEFTTLIYNKVNKVAGRCTCGKLMAKGMPLYNYAGYQVKGLHPEVLSTWYAFDVNFEEIKHDDIGLKVRCVKE